MAKLPGRRIVAKKKAVKRTAGKKPRLGLRVSRGVDLLLELPEGSLSIREQSVLMRIKNVNAGVGQRMGQRLTEADYTNLKRIAAKHSIKLP